MDGVAERLARVEVTIWFLVDADAVSLTTMNMTRQWTQNVQVNRDVAIPIGPETLAGEARVVTEPSEMAKYWLSRPYLWLKKRPDGVFRVHFKY